MSAALRGGMLASLAALALGCSRMPKPAEPVEAPPVFAIAGDTSEVLSTIPAPVVHGRPAGLPASEPEDTSGAPASGTDSTAAVESSNAPGTSAADTGAASPSPERPAPEPIQPLTSRRANADWVVQVFASADRAKAYSEAQRAGRQLGLSEEDVTLDFRDRIWRVRVGQPATRKDAEAFLARARGYYPRAFLVPVPEATKP